MSTKKIFELAFVAVLTQLLPLAVLPITSRYITAEEYGQFALLNSYVAIVLIVSTGKYESALSSTKNPSDHMNLIVGAALLSGATSILGAVIVFTFLELTTINNTGNLGNKSYALFVGLLVFLQSINVISQSFLTRWGEFRVLSKSKLIQTVSTAGIQLVLVVMSPTVLSLLIGSVLGFVLGLVSVFQNITVRSNFKGVNKIRYAEVRATLLRFINYPIHTIPTDGIITLLTQAPIFFLTSNYGTQVAGWYAMTQRTLLVPMRVVSMAIGSVYRNEISDTFNNKGDCKAVYIKYSFILAAIGLSAFFVIYNFSPVLYSIVLGEEWRISGEIAIILSFLYGMKFFVSPLTFILFVQKKTGANLAAHVTLLIIFALIFYFFDFESYGDALMVYSIIYGVFYCQFYVIGYKLSKGVKNERS